MSRGLRPHDRTRHGRWTFVHDQLGTGRKLRVLMITRYRRGPDVVKILEEAADNSDPRRQSEAIKAQSSSHAISTCGLINAVLRSTSRDRASPPTRPSSSHSMPNF